MVESDVRHAAWVLLSWGFSAKPWFGNKDTLLVSL